MKIKIFVLALIFCFSLTLRMSTLNQIGRTWDEAHFIEEGYKMVELFRNGDFSNSFFYTSYDHPPLIKYIFGSTSYLDLNEDRLGKQPLFNYDYTYSRTLSAIFFSIGVVVTVLLGWRLFSPLVGIVSGVILSMLPFSLGLSQLVSTEGLKIFIYPIAIYSILRLVEKFTLKKVLITGVIIGIALQIKQSNGLLFLISIGMFIIHYRTLNVKQKIGYIKSRLIGFLIIILVSIVTFISFWPHLLFNFLKVYEIHNKFWGLEFTAKPWLITMSVPEVFLGSLVMTPNFYYFVYFFISIPVLILILFFFGVKNIFDSKKWQLYILIIWFSAPFVLSFYSWRQHGLRYLIEIYPAIALISAIGFDTLTSKFTSSFYKKVLILIPIMIYLFFILANIRPYYLDYYNEFVGGTGNVYRANLFQIGWWGQGLREAGQYVAKNSEKGSTVGLAISPEHVLFRSDELIYTKWEEGKTYDYIIVNHYHIIRDGFDDKIIRDNYKLVYNVKADGATLVYIYKNE